MIDKLKEILYENTGLTNVEITKETNLKNDLGLNSLDLANLACAIEEKFDIEIPDEYLPQIKTVNDVVLFIEQQ